MGGAGGAGGGMGGAGGNMMMPPVCAPCLGDGHCAPLANHHCDITSGTCVPN